MSSTTTPSPALLGRLRRARDIRRRVTATALATFVLAFGVIAQTGSLGAESATRTTAAGAATTTATSSSHDATAVTTRQS
jgi:hypothetical protein